MQKYYGKFKLLIWDVSPKSTSNTHFIYCVLPIIPQRCWIMVMVMYHLIYIYIHTYIHICLLLIAMLWHRQAIFKSKGDKLCSSAESRIWTRDPRHRFASRLNARWHTDWTIVDQAKNLNSTARPYDQRAFSPLGPTVSWLSHLALAIYMFVIYIYIYIYSIKSTSKHSSCTSIFWYYFLLKEILIRIGPTYFMVLASNEVLNQ